MLKKVSERTVSLLNIIILVNYCYVKYYGKQEIIIGGNSIIKLEVLYFTKNLKIIEKFSN